MEYNEEEVLGLPAVDGLEDTGEPAREPSLWNRRLLLFLFFFVLSEPIGPSKTMLPSPCPGKLARDASDPLFLLSFCGKASVGLEPLLFFLRGAGGVNMMTNNGSDEASNNPISPRARTT